MKKIAIIILAIISLSFAYHEYFVSVTDGEYQQNEGTFQFTIKFIGHDLEKAIEVTGSPELKLGEEKELATANEYISKYINDKFSIKCNDKLVPLKLIGKEVGKDDFIYCYMESDKIKKIKTIEVYNSLLTEVFPKQENIFYLQINGKKYDFYFKPDKTTFNITL